MIGFFLTFTLLLTALKVTNTEFRNTTRLRGNVDINTKVTLKLGVLIPLTGHVSRNVLGVISVALNKVRENQNEQFKAIADNGKIDFTYEWKDTHCEMGKGLNALIELWIKNSSGVQTAAFIGKCAFSIRETQNRGTIY